MKQKSNGSKKDTLVGFIAVVIIFIIFYSIASARIKASQAERDAQKEIQDVTETTSEESIEIDVIEKFVTDFNAKSTVPLQYVEDFVPSDDKGKHYRVEFRLNAYKEAVGKSYTYEGTIVDIIEVKAGAKNVDRIYMDGATLEQCKSMVSNAAQLIDDRTEQKDIDYILDYMDKYKDANGELFGHCQLLLLKRGEDSYEFMLK
jgi:hypothetical protein